MQPRFIEVPSETPLFDVKLGYVLEREAKAREIDLDELAVKCRRGAGYLQRIKLGTAPFMQVHDIRRICESLDIRMSDFFTMVEKTNTSEVRLARSLQKHIIWAGGNRNPRNKDYVKPVPPTRKKRRKLKVVR